MMNFFNDAGFQLWWDTLLNKLLLPLRTIKSVFKTLKQQQKLFKAIVEQPRQPRLESPRAQQEGKHIEVNPIFSITFPS